MKKITLGILLLYGFVVQAQLTVSNTENPAQLVQNVLVGQGVTPLNVKFNGAVVPTPREQAGHFITNFNPTNLGLSAGVILSTGKATDAPGPNNSGSSTSTPTNPQIGDPDLQMLASSTVGNVSIIEFDFVATGLVMNFDYVFASEEYPEYVYTTYNDVFGFFLRGPGITGPFSGNAKNIALVPNSTTPITINTVNNGNNNTGIGAANAAYYVNNTNLGQNPSTANPTVMYDGFTAPLTATSTLQCGQTYHIKLAIGNVGDNSYDSAVFLKNFTIPPMRLIDSFNLDVNSQVCYGLPDSIISGYGTATTFTFEWLHDGVVMPNEHGPDLIIDPAVGIPPVVTDASTLAASGTYTLNVYTNTGCLLATDDIVIGWRPRPPFAAPQSINLCTLLPPPYTFNIDQTALIMGTAINPGDYTVTYYSSSEMDAVNGVSTGVIPDADLANYITNNSSSTIWIRLEPLIGCITVLTFDLNASPAPSGNIGYPNAAYCTSINTLQAINSTVTPGGVYSATPAGLNIDPLTGAINPSLSTPANYVVNYNLAASGSCPAFSPTPANVAINLSPIAPIVVSPLNYCQNYAAPALTTTTGSNLLWYTTATGGIGNATAIIPDTSTSGIKTYYVSQTNTGCESLRASIVVNVFAAPVSPIVSGPFTYCQNETATQLTATGAGLLWYTAATGGTGNVTAPTPNTATAGNITYYVSQTISGCESPRASILVTTNATPALPAVTSPIDYCQNATANVLTATGTGLLWYTTATGGIGNAVAPTPSTATVGSTIYYVSQTISGCEGPRTPITVTIKPIPGLPVVSSPLSYCQNATAAVLTATGSNLLWYTLATGGTGNATAPTPSTISSGSTTYYVSQTTNGCEGARAAIVVAVLATPTAPIVSGPLTYCQNETATQLTATGVGLLWYTAATGGIGSVTAPTPNTATAGNVTYYVSQTISGCESPRASILVTTNATPALPAVTSPIDYCQNATANLLTATGTGLLWYTTATGGIGNAVALTPSTATVGNTIYYVSQTISGCEGPRAPITVTIKPIPGLPAVSSPLSYCQNATAAVLTATGSNLLWYTLATGGTGNTTAPTPSTISSGSTTYYVSQTTNGCEGARAAIVVAVLATPTAPIVSGPLTYCQNETATQLTATGVVLLWYTAATGGIGSVTAPTPNTATAGNITYYVSQTISGCEGPRASILVTTNATPALPAVTSPIGYCQNATANVLSATGTGLLWYTTATGGIGNAVAPTPSTATVGSTIYYVSQTISGCEGPRASVMVDISLSPIVPTVIQTPIIYCQNNTAAVLTATGSNLLWYAAAIGGTGNSTAPTPSTTAAGTTTYYVSQTTNSCEGPRAAIVVTVLPTPAMPSIFPITYCLNASAMALTATGTSLLWYAAATGGTGSTAAPIPSTSAAGNTTYYVSQTISGCEGPRAGIVVTVKPATPAPAVLSPVSYCQNSTANQLSATGSNLMWYAAATGGIGSSTPPAFNTANVVTATYYVSQTISGCEGPRASITINILPTPSAPTVNALTYCQNETAPALTALGNNLLWYVSATGGIGNATAPTPNTSLIGSVTYYVSQTTNTCESSRAALVVEVKPLPTPALQDGQVCIDSQTNTVLAPYTLNSGLSGTAYTFEWYVLNAGTYTIIPSQTQNTYTVDAAGVYGVRAINNTTNCASGITTATVSLTPTPQAVEVAGANYFADEQLITVNVNPIGNYHYQLDNGAFQTGNIFTNVAPGNHTVLVKSECGEFTKQVFLLDYPRYFTPNGDGYNDVWNIFGLSGQANAKIYIFDRFGKLLKEISPSGIGWDGKYNQQNLPSTDYWFIVHYEENKINKIFKSHFALKR